MSSGLFAVLEAMENRDKAGNRRLLRDEETTIIEKDCLRPAANEVYGRAQQKLGGGIEDAQQSLWEWFLRDRRKEAGEKGAPIWRKAWQACADQDPSIRDKSLARYLKTCAERWLRKTLSDSDAALHQQVLDALNDKRVFARCGDGSGAAGAYTLRDRDLPLDPLFDAGRFAQTLGWRHFRNRSGDYGQNARLRIAIPDASDLRDALAEAMDQAQRAFTVDQAVVVVRWVFALSSELPDESPEDSEKGSVTFEGATREPPEIQSAVKAIVEEIERKDQLPAFNRPADSTRGRVARYVLDFELWDGWPLQPGEETDRLREKAGQTGKSVNAEVGIYDLVLFEAWSGVPDSSVSDWRAERRWELYAVGLSAGLGWGLPRARNFLDPKRSPEERRKHSEAFHLFERLFWALRRRFLQRKPEFVSAAPFERWMEDNA